MKIEKKIEVEVKITMNEWEIKLLQKYLNWAYIHAEASVNYGKISTLGYDSWQECRVDMEKVMNKIFDI